MIQQVASSKPVAGSFACLAGSIADHAAQAGVNSDQDFADAVGYDGTWEYIGQAHDGGYIYEVTIADASTGYVVRVDADGKVVGVS